MNEVRRLQKLNLFILEQIRIMYDWSEAFKIMTGVLTNQLSSFEINLLLGPGPALLATSHISPVLIFLNS